MRLIPRRPARSTLTLPPELSILDALRDSSLLGGVPAFHDLASWTRWLVFLKAVYGLLLEPAELEVFREHTGRQVPRTGGYPEAVVITGRQSGKTRIAATVAAFEALRASQEPDRTELYAAMVSQDQRSSIRTLLRYAAAPFDLVPGLKGLVRGQTSDTLTLANGVTLAAYPCRPAAVRGIRARVVVVDELAFFRSESGHPADTEMLRAVRPCVATTGGKLVILSSPYAQAGELWTLHRRHWAQEESSTLIWCASAPTMNPSLPADYLARMQADDPEAFRSEVLGEFRAGVSTFFDPDALAACIAEGLRERPPVPDVGYVAFTDPSGGRRDRFTVAIAHAEGSGAVLDAARAWSPPLNPSGVVAEIAELLRRYRLTEVSGDKYAGEFVAEAFRALGITYRASARDASALYLDLLPRINAGQVVLLDHAELLRELRGLERRAGSFGRDRVDHRPGDHDDLANAAAGALVEVATEAAEPPLMFWGGGTIYNAATDELLTYGEAEAQERLQDSERLAAGDAVPSGGVRRVKQHVDPELLEGLRRGGGAWFPSD